MKRTWSNLLPLDQVVFEEEYQGTNSWVWLKPLDRVQADYAGARATTKLEVAPSKGSLVKLNQEQKKLL